MEDGAVVTTPRALERMAMMIAPQNATICEDHAAVAATAIPCAAADRASICMTIPIFKTLWRKATDILYEVY